MSSSVGKTASTVPAVLAGLMPEFWARSAVGLCLTDDKGIICAANAAFASSVGYTPEDLAGLPIIRLLAAENSVHGSVAHSAFLRGDEQVTADITYLHKSGRPIFAHVSDMRLRAVDGRFFRLTQLVDLERQASGVRQLRQHQQVENFTALASDISNDFNNLLSIILGYTAYLQDGVLDRSRLKTAVGGIDHAVRRAADLIRQTLYLSRRDELSFKRIELGDFVRDYLRMANDTVAAEMSVSIDLPGDLPAVSLDPKQFHQVITNLMQKSRDLTGPGGRLRFKGEVVQGAVVGGKFPDAREPLYVQLSLITEPAESKFVEGERAGTWDAAVRFTERRNDLSVLVVHNILGIHRAHMELDALSSPALQFRLYVPVVTEPVPAKPAPEESLPAGTPAQSRTVLVVDDEDMFLQALDFFFKRHGFTVIKARDGVQAVEEFTRHAAEISLVVIDLGLPKMSGWEAFLKIREHSPDINVIVMSGHLEANLKTEIMKAGAKGYLQKPFTMDEVLAEVNRFFATGG